MAGNSGTTSFVDALNAQKVKPVQWLIVATCMLVLIADGMDLQLLGIVAPLVIEAFDTDRATFGYAMGAALIGFGLGSWMGGVLGDRIGRRWTLVIAALVFSFATVGAGSSTGVWSMAGWRVIGGLGFGAAYANALAMAGEWLPDRWRPICISTLSVGTPIGGSIVGWFGPDLAAANGWDGTFVVIGLGTAVMALVILVVLRDSPSFLMALGKKDAAQKNARMVLDGDFQLVPDKHETDSDDGTPIGVFHPSNTRLNLGVGLAFAASAMVAYSILSWSTVMLTERGFTLDDAGDVVALVGLTSMAGSIIVGEAMRRLGSKRVMIFISVALLAVMVGLGYAIEHLPAEAGSQERQFVTWLAGGAGALFSAGIAGMYVLMAHGYPQSCRSAGIGFGIFMSRAGAIGGSMFGGALLALGGASAMPFFAVQVFATLLIALAAFVVDRHVPPLPR